MAGAPPLPPPPGSRPRAAPPIVPPPPGPSPPPPSTPARLWRRGHPLPLVRLGFGEVFDATFGLIRLHWRPLLGAAVLVAIPLALASAWIVWATVDPRLRRLDLAALDRTDDPAAALRILLDLFLPFAAVALVSLLVATPLLAAVTARLIGAAYLGQRPEVGAAFRVALRRAGPLFAAVVLVTLAEAVGYAALVVPGVVLFVRLLFVPAVIAVQGGGPIHAIERSWRLSAGRGWPIFGVILLANLLVGALGGALATPVGLLLPSSSVATQLALQSAIGGVVTPLATVFAVVLYLDARVRKDELDHARLADELAGR